MGNTTTVFHQLYLVLLIVEGHVGLRHEEGLGSGVVGVRRVHDTPVGRRSGARHRRARRRQRQPAAAALRAAPGRPLGQRRLASPGAARDAAALRPHPRREPAPLRR